MGVGIDNPPPIFWVRGLSPTKEDSWEVQMREETVSRLAGVAGGAAFVTYIAGSREAALWIVGVFFALLILWWAMTEARRRRDQRDRDQDRREG